MNESIQGMRSIFLAGLAGILALATLPALAQVPAPARFDGTWQGSLSVNGARIRVVFHVSRSDDDTLAASLDSPDQGATGIPVDSVAVDGDSIRFDVGAINAAYTGKLSGEGSIAGTWRQGGVELPLEVTRTEEPVALARPQEPEPPYRYDEEAVKLAAGERVELAGTLTLPRGERPYPGVVLVTGSGPQDRDEAIAGHRPFLVLADALTRRGIAVLRLDDRGVGGSSGSTLDSTLEDRADDTLAALRLLRRRAEVDPARVGLLGHSEGGWVIPIVASRVPDEVAFLVMLAGPAQSPRDLLRSQEPVLLEAMGADPATISAVRKLNEQVFDILRETPDRAEARERIGRAREEVDARLIEVERQALDEYLAEQPDSAREAQQRTANTAWFRDLIAFDPEPYLRATEQPLLALYGSNDLQVPAEENASLLEQILAERPGYSVHVLDGHNHLFQQSETGLPAEYALIDTTIEPAVLELIGDWIAAQQ